MPNTVRRSQPAITALVAVLPHAINFRFLPARAVADPIWSEVAREVLEGLEKAGLVVLTQADLDERMLDAWRPAQ